MGAPVIITIDGLFYAGRDSFAERIVKSYEGFHHLSLSRVLRVIAERMAEKKLAPSKWDDVCEVAERMAPQDMLDIPRKRGINPVEAAKMKLYRAQNPGERVVPEDFISPWADVVAAQRIMRHRDLADVMAPKFEQIAQTTPRLVATGTHMAGGVFDNPAVSFFLLASKESRANRLMQSSVFRPSISDDGDAFTVVSDFDTDCIRSTAQAWRANPRVYRKELDLPGAFESEGNYLSFNTEGKAIHDLMQERVYPFIAEHRPDLEITLRHEAKKQARQRKALDHPPEAA